MTEPSARIILDSISPTGCRLTTMEVVIHRFVLSEFNTHRVFSRNSASSRAIPVRKQLERVITDPAIPISWPSEKPGMQGGDEQGEEARAASIQWWLRARDAAVKSVEALTDTGLIAPLHKSVANRLLEPFMWHTIIVSSTEWENFFGLRCNPMAQPEIRAAAESMRMAYSQSIPTQLGRHQWHMPFVTGYDEEEMAESLRGGPRLPVVARKISAARCARVSYLTHDGTRDWDADIKLYERLTSAEPAHASPLEHVATPEESWARTPLGNFKGWHQLRHWVGA